ncbi:MAG: glycosyltransferase family 9 protein [Synergistaceae bacterium]|nr:glycosyltransferase family 9 protein [Synergistaceae bacterium]
MATPFFQNLDSPVIYIPHDDPRLEPIKSISLWPVVPLQEKSFDQGNHSRVFVLWCWPNDVQITGKCIIRQPSPNWDDGEYEPESYLSLVSPSVRNYHPSAVRLVREWRLHIGKKERLVAIYNGANPKWLRKLWPVDYWIELLKTILAKYPDVQFVHLGAGSEKHFGAALAAVFRNKVWTFAGELSMAGSADVLSQCAFAIGNDTGLMHVADAVGCCGVAIFGSTSWSKNRSANGNMVLIKGDGGGCANYPCFGTREMWQCKDGAVCMAAIKPEQVVKVVIDGFLKNSESVSNAQV